MPDLHEILKKKIEAQAPQPYWGFFPHASAKTFLRFQIQAGKYSDDHTLLPEQS